MLGADLGAALGDVAETHAVRAASVPAGGHRCRAGAFPRRRYAPEIARANELLVYLMIAQDVADVLAQKALDALAEFLDAVDIVLLQSVQVPSEHRASRLNGLMCFLTREFDRHVGNESGSAERPASAPGEGRIRVTFVQPRHAHEARLAVDLAEQEPHLPALQFQRHRQVVGLRRLDLMDGVEDDHAGRDRRGVIDEFAARALLRQMRRVTICWVAEVVAVGGTVCRVAIKSAPEIESNVTNRACHVGRGCCLLYTFWVEMVRGVGRREKQPNWWCISWGCGAVGPSSPLSSVRINWPSNKMRRSRCHRRGDGRDVSIPTAIDSHISHNHCNNDQRHCADVSA